MTQHKIAIPTDKPGGQNALISSHFGHCDVFTVITLEGQKIVESTLIEVPGHTHGGCMAPVRALVEAGAEAVIVQGIGQRPLQGFEQFGVTVYHAGQCSDVQQTAQAFLDQKLSVISLQQTCAGGCAH